MRGLMMAIVACAGLMACDKVQVTQGLTNTDLIQKALIETNKARAGEPGVPVELSYIASGEGGGFTAGFQSEDRKCQYKVGATSVDGKVAVSQHVVSQCGANATTIQAFIVPRNRPRLSRECQQADDNSRVQCYAAVISSNEQLTLVAGR